MNLNIIKSLQSYDKAYVCIGTIPKSRDELVELLSNDGSIKSRTTISKYVQKSFDGELPMLVIRDDRISVDEVELRNFVEDLCKSLGTDAGILFTEPVPTPKGRKEKDAPIPVIDGVKSPVVRELRKKISDQKSESAKKEKEMQELLAKKDEVIARLQKRIHDDVGKAILTEMDKKPVILSSIESKPEEVFQRDFFLDNPGKLLDIPMLVSKYGGERDPFYKSIRTSQQELTTENYRKRVATILFKSKFFENRANDVERLLTQKNPEKDIYKNRLESIKLLLQAENMSNQMKLSLYAGWHEYHGTEMEDLLNFAGDHCIDANYVITLLERPMDFNNYQNVRGFLRQACKASEARMKRETVRELIAGEWYVLADYNGQLCRFQMMPVSELLKFRKALLENHYGEAVFELEKLLATVRNASFEDDDPDKKLMVKDTRIKQSYEGYFRDAAAMIHGAEKGYEMDVHAPMDDESSFVDFSESEVKEDDEQ